MQTTPDGIRIYGNLKPEDDFTHELGPEENFNESVYFNFFDPAQNRGGFVRMGNRANEGYAEMTVIVWNPDGSAVFNYAKPSISTTMPGMPTVYRWTSNPTNLSAVLTARGYIWPTLGTWQIRVKRSNRPPDAAHDLHHEAVGPMYGHVGDPDDGNQFARAHTEQRSRIYGGIQIGNEAPEDFGGWGLRDHSWDRDTGRLPSTDGSPETLATPRHDRAYQPDGEGGGLFHEVDLVRCQYQADHRI